jgi:choline kinase
VKGIILAAGVSSRLRPLTNATPKCLLKLGNQTILERSLNNLIASGIENIVVVTGYLEHQIKDFVAEKFPRLQVKFLSNRDYASNNNVYSLWMTKESVMGDDIILLDSDIVFDGRILESLMASGYGNCLAVNTKIELAEEEIKVKVDVNNRIVAIGKEVPLKESFGESIGIERFSSALLHKLFAVLDRKILKEKNVDQFYEAAFQEVIDGGGEIYAVDVSQFRCIEIDTLEDIEVAKSEVIPYLDELHWS